MEKIIRTVPGKCRKKREKARLTLNNNPEISWHMKKSRRTYNGVHLNKKSNTQDVVEQSLTICLRAIKAEKSNFPDIPEKYRNSDILESLFAHRNFMHYLHLIPSSSWNNGTVRDAIYSLYRDVQQNGGYRYCSERYEQQFLYETSVMLSFVPRQAKDFRLWKELIHDGRIATMTIDKMMPKCFKQAAYYKEWAIRCIKEVDTR